jgi:hypothetical protein
MFFFVPSENCNWKTNIRCFERRRSEGSSFLLFCTCFLALLGVNTCLDSCDSECWRWNNTAIAVKVGENFRAEINSDVRLNSWTTEKRQKSNECQAFSHRIVLNFGWRSTHLRRSWSQLCNRRLLKSISMRTRWNQFRPRPICIWMLHKNSCAWHLATVCALNCPREVKNCLIWVIKLQKWIFFAQKATLHHHQHKKS